MATKSSIRSIKRTVYFNGKDISLTLREGAWKAFRVICDDADLSPSEKIAGWQLNDRDAIVPRIEAEVSASGEKVYLHANRETWLTAIVDGMRPMFKERGYPLPDKIRVAIGFPGAGYRGKARGDCWPASASSDGYVQIFIKPTEQTVRDVAQVLTHELCHAAQDLIAGKVNHGKLFAQIAEAMDQEGKPAHAVGEATWWEWASEIVDAAGELPHGALTAFEPKPKQTTRMLKCQCPNDECGVVWRMSRKHIENQKTLYCPCCDDGELDVGALLADMDGVGDSETEAPAGKSAERAKKTAAEPGQSKIVRKIGDAVANAVRQQKAARKSPAKAKSKPASRKAVADAYSARDGDDDDFVV